MKRLWIVAVVVSWRVGGAIASDVDTACLDCHRGAQSKADVPTIEGQHREYLVHQLQRFRERHRDSFPMSAFAGGMDDAAVRDHAMALAERPWPPSVPAVVADDAVRRGREAAARRDCAGCHGTDFLGEGDVPRLAGQLPGYLARQIEGFGHGDRFHPPTGTGSPMRTVPAAEARDLAAFLYAIDADRDKP